MADTYETTMMPDDGEKLSIPYGSLRPNAPAPVSQTPSQPSTSQQTPQPAPPSTEKK
jgi:hypothetical protein